MSNKLKIKSTYMPEKPLDTNEWFEIYKVGSRVEKYNKENNAPNLNSQYDFTKLFPSTEKVDFMGRIKNLILVDLW